MPMAKRVAGRARGRAAPTRCSASAATRTRSRPSASSGSPTTTRARARSAASSPRSSGPTDGLWDTVVVSACDHPWLDGETVENLLFGLIKAPLARPATGPDGRAPLFFAANVAEVLPVVRDLFDGGERSMRWLGARLPVGTVHPIDLDRLRDVDTPDDLP